jgi:hypothetical protein
VIEIPLRRNAQSPKNLDRVKSAILGWDERRKAESGAESSAELWDVIYCFRGGLFVASNPFVRLSPIVTHL